MKFSRLILANLFGKKVRLILTIGSFAVALVLFTFLAVVKSAFSRGTEIAGADRLIVVSRIGLMQLMPISHRDKILAIPGVKAVTHNHWFGGVYQDEKNFFPQFVIDPENQRQVMTELVVPDEQWNNFMKDRQGAIAGARTAARFHWKIGDRKSTRLNSSHGYISYAVFCLKKKNQNNVNLKHACAERAPSPPSLQLRSAMHLCIVYH